MAENEVPKVNSTGYMANNVQVNWNAVKKIYGGGNPRIPMVDRKHTCFFY